MDKQVLKQTVRPDDWVICHYIWAFVAMKISSLAHKLFVKVVSEFFQINKNLIKVAKYFQNFAKLEKLRRIWSQCGGGEL